MKILIVGTAYPLRGGIAHYNALLAEHLSTRHAVETITFKRQYPKILFPGKTQEETGGGIHARPAPQLIDSINPFNWIHVTREIRRRNPEALIFKYWLPFFGPCFGTIAKLANRKTAAKVLFICDNILPHERRPGDILFTNYAFRHADYFIGQSETVEQGLLKYFHLDRDRKVPHAVHELFGNRVQMEEAKKNLGVSW